MANFSSSLNNIKILEELAVRKIAINQLHPLIKLITTFIFIIVVISFDKFEVSNLLPFILYPLFIFIAGEIPFKPILTRFLLVVPLIIGIGIFNPFFDQQIYYLGKISFARGWVSFFSIILKSFLTITASLLLIATSGIEEIGFALRLLKVPKIFVLQLLLTYRYINVLVEEISLMSIAYSLRAPRHKGIHFKLWGSFAGQIIIRTYERAQQIYNAMILRGFDGEYLFTKKKKIQKNDLLFLAFWLTFFICCKIYNIPNLLGILTSKMVG